MLINDLSYCEVVEENVVGGFGFVVAGKDVAAISDVDQDYDVDVNIDIDKDINSDIKSKVDLKGNFASVTFDATAIGSNTYTQADVSAFATAGLSESSGTLVAAVD
ncbi:hypothetical protein ACL6C3_12080 [Capilliphycus salinus ALCB114379]|uniref:hypothetical protein n=1 Tax=Capilliphycus salinus TaxID=2768948 RepID=UPI0039A64F9F